MFFVKILGWFFFPLQWDFTGLAINRHMGLKTIVLQYPTFPSSNKILLSAYVAGFPSPEVSDIFCYGYCEIIVFTVKHKSV